MRADERDLDAGHRRRWWLPDIHIATHHFTSTTTTFLPNAIGTSISGSAQVINTGRDVVLHGSLSPPPTGLPELLRPVSNATHTLAGHVARCDPGARLEVIARIEKWFNGSDKRAAKYPYAHAIHYHLVLTTALPRGIPTK